MQLIKKNHVHKEMGVSPPEINFSLFYLNYLNSHKFLLESSRIYFKQCCW